MGSISAETLAPCRAVAVRERGETLGRSEIDCAENRFDVVVEQHQNALSWNRSSNGPPQSLSRSVSPSVRQVQRDRIDSTYVSVARSSNQRVC